MDVFVDGWRLIASVSDGWVVLGVDVVLEVSRGATCRSQERAWRGPCAVARKTLIHIFTTLAADACF